MAWRATRLFLFYFLLDFVVFELAGLDLFDAISLAAREPSLGACFLMWPLVLLVSCLPLSGIFNLLIYFFLSIGLLIVSTVVVRFRFFASLRAMNRPLFASRATLEVLVSFPPRLGIEHRKPNVVIVQIQ